MTKVLVFGTFDNIHPGHVNFLKQARQYGEYLIASVARDEFVLRIKGRAPIHSQEQRIRHVMQSGLIDAAYLSDEAQGSYSLVEKLGASVVCFGHDQIELEENFSDWLTRRSIKIRTVILKAYKPEKYKSSKMKKS